MLLELVNHIFLQLKVLVSIYLYYLTDKLTNPLLQKGLFLNYF